MCPLPFEKSSSTRWLVRGNIMYNVLVNLKELEAYFAYEESALHCPILMQNIKQNF